MQCGPDEPSWTWTQIWVQVRKPDYRFKGPVLYKGDNNAARPPEGGLTATSLPLYRWPSQGLLTGLAINRTKVVSHYRAAWTESSSMKNISGNTVLT